MDNNFLLTFTYENTEGMSDRDYKWYESEEAMLEDIEIMKQYVKDFKITDAIEILQLREIETE